MKKEIFLKDSSTFKRLTYKVGHLLSELCQNSVGTRIGSKFNFVIRHLISNFAK